MVKCWKYVVRKLGDCGTKKKEQVREGLLYKPQIYNQTAYTQAWCVFFFKLTVYIPISATFSLKLVLTTETILRFGPTNYPYVKQEAESSFHGCGCGFGWASGSGCQSNRQPSTLNLTYCTIFQPNFFKDIQTLL